MNRGIVTNHSLGFYRIYRVVWIIRPVPSYELVVYRMIHIICHIKMDGFVLCKVHMQGTFQKSEL
jgi:hypothetical protein